MWKKKTPQNKTKNLAPAPLLAFKDSNCAIIIDKRKKESGFPSVCIYGVVLRSLARCLNSPLCVYTSGFPCLQPIPHLEAILDTDQ